MDSPLLPGLDCGFNLAENKVKSKASQAELRQRTIFMPSKLHKDFLLRVYTFSKLKHTKV